VRYRGKRMERTKKRRKKKIKERERQRTKKSKKLQRKLVQGGEEREVSHTFSPKNYSVLQKHLKIVTGNQRRRGVKLKRANHPGKAEKTTECRNNESEKCLQEQQKRGKKGRKAKKTIIEHIKKKGFRKERNRAKPVQKAKKGLVRGLSKTKKQKNPRRGDKKKKRSDENWGSTSLLDSQSEVLEEHWRLGRDGRGKGSNETSLKREKKGGSKS